MPDAIFAHPRLAQVYDAFDGPRDDLAAYVAIAQELNASRVLDVGSGTGCLAIAPVRLLPRRVHLRGRRRGHHLGLHAVLPQP